MSFIKLFFGLLSIWINLYIVYTYFDTIFGNPRFKMRYLIIIYSVVALVESIVKFFFFYNKLMILLVFICILILSFLYSKSNLVRLLSSTIMLIIIILSETISGTILVFIIKHNVDELQQNTLFYLFGMFLAILFEFLIVKALNFKKLSSEYRVSKKLFVPLISLPLASLLMIYTVMEYAGSITESRPIVLISFSVFFLIVSNLLVFYLFENHLKSEADKRYNQLIEQQLKNQAQYFKDIAEKQKLSNKAIHDTKNQLFAVSILLSNNQTDLAKKKIDDLCRNVFQNLNYSKTGNDAIDALINNKYQLIQESGITFHSDFKINSQNEIDDIELCIILGNALDNAIEACQKIKSGDKEITVRAIQINDYLSIEVSNTIVKPVELYDGKPVTTKEDKDLHGFGLQSIEEIVNKYDGHMNLIQDKNRFSLKIYVRNLLPVPVAQK